MRPPRALPRHLWPDGYLANTFVPKTAPQYRKLMDIIASAEVPITSRNKSYGAPTMAECAQILPDGVIIPLLWLK